MAFAEDYVDVATRIGEFREKYPNGSLQPADLSTPYRVELIGDQTYIVVVAAAYRTPDDPRPGIGMAFEQFPGKTPYTRGSELQNAETSAWGRAIVAALAADTKRGVASADEVRNRQAERSNTRTEDQWQSPDPVKLAKSELWQTAKSLGMDLVELNLSFEQFAGAPLADADETQLRAYTETLKADGVPS